MRITIMPSWSAQNSITKRLSLSDEISRLQSAALNRARAILDTYSIENRLLSIPSRLAGCFVVWLPQTSTAACDATEKSRCQDIKYVFWCISTWWPATLTSCLVLPDDSVARWQKVDGENRYNVGNFAASYMPTTFLPSTLDGNINDSTFRPHCDRYRFT